ncbi:iron ABC transporter substrate-binding protein [Promicromonospora sukumoe]|uniref:Iron(III) transport system substrate-binding protein n=1 Tax=Promicromonospora sukumoe TaxID=88382 RepID=A0A7W3PDR1_9MICO|nr:extracellular solute-binding protein [Promicromonospora sukumoe]MBA8807822.1 iron(III) transport system substrate-binding protein [Promicromonospora sukumoe]
MRAARRTTTVVTLALAASFGLAGCSSGTEPAEAGSEAPAADDGPLVVYSGRSEDLVAPLFEMFEQETGIETEVRYASSAEQAQLLLTEGENSPGHVFLSQEAGALGLVSEAGHLVALPEETLGQVPEAYTSDDGTWVGVTGRARVVIYDSERVEEADAPETAEQIVDPQWAGKVAVAPGNASFLSFVTAMRLTEGEEATAQWLEALAANDVQTYDGNDDILEAVNSGEVELGLVNHYYWYAAAAEQGEDAMRAGLKFGAPGDVAGLVNATGVGILTAGEGRADAQELVDYLLSDPAQEFFAEEEFEYPLVADVTGPEGVPPLDSLSGPAVDLSDLGTVDETAAMLDDAGITVG